MAHRSSGALLWKVWQENAAGLPLLVAAVSHPMLPLVHPGAARFCGATTAASFPHAPL